MYNNNEIISQNKGRRSGPLAWSVGEQCVGEKQRKKNKREVWYEKGREQSFNPHTKPLLPLSLPISHAAPQLTT